MLGLRPAPELRQLDDGDMPQVGKRPITRAEDEQVEVNESMAAALPGAGHAAADGDRLAVPWKAEMPHPAL